MPDWLLSITYIVIVVSTVILITLLTGDILGLLLGLLGGHYLASALLKLLPGFWDN